MIYHAYTMPTERGPGVTLVLIIDGFPSPQIAQGWLHEVMGEYHDEGFIQSTGTVH